MTNDTENALVAGIASVQATLEAQNKVLAEHGRSLAAINYTLNGNGKPGLKQDVARNKADISAFKKILWVVVAPVLAALGTGLVTATVYLIRSIR
jgi:hypothetical protein